MRFVFVLMIAASFSFCYAGSYNRCPASATYRYDEHQSFSLGQLITTFSRTSPASDELVRLIAANPCLQVLYTGSKRDFSKSQSYVLYATCNLERMVRFNLRYSNASDCWNMELKLWDPSTGARCQRLQIANVYTIEWSLSRRSSICVGATDSNDPFALHRAMVFMDSKESLRGPKTMDEDVTIEEQNLTIVNRTGCLCETFVADGDDNLEMLANNDSYETFWNERCAHTLLSTLKSSMLKVGLGITIMVVWSIALLTFYYQKRA